MHTSEARSKLVHSSALGKKSPYNCQKLPSQSNAYKRRHANLRSQSVCHKDLHNYIKQITRTFFTFVAGTIVKTKGDTLVMYVFIMKSENNQANWLYLIMK